MNAAAVKERRKPGPKPAAGVLRSRQLLVRFTPDEFRRVVRRAQQLNKGTAAHVRDLALADAQGDGGSDAE